MGVVARLDQTIGKRAEAAAQLGGACTAPVLARGGIQVLRRDALLQGLERVFELALLGQDLADGGADTGEARLPLGIGGVGADERGQQLLFLAQVDQRIVEHLARLEQVADMRVRQRQVVLPGCVAAVGGGEALEDRDVLLIELERLVVVALCARDLGDAVVGEGEIALERGVGGFGSRKTLQDGEALAEALERFIEIDVRLLLVPDLVGGNREVAVHGAELVVGHCEPALLAAVFGREPQKILAQRQVCLVARQRIRQLAPLQQDVGEAVAGSRKVPTAAQPKIVIVFGAGIARGAGKIGRG